MKGFDFETHLIRPGMVAPRPVVLSYADDRAHLIVDRREMCAWFERQFQSEELVGHNVAFDLVVAAAEWPHLLRSIMDAIDAGRVHCTMIRQALLDIAAGESEFRRRDDKVTKTSRALGALGELYFGELWAKGEETYRLRYGELDGVPLEDWPAAAVDYPLQDAERPLRVFAAQAERAKELRALEEMRGVWESKPGEIPDEIPQTRKALWLQLMSSWGLRTDPAMVAEVRADYERDQAEVRRRLMPLGLIREDGTRDMEVIRDRVLKAYAARGLEAPRTAPSSRSTDGQVKADTDTLVESGDNDLAFLGESLSDASTINTWLRHLEDGTRHPICVGYNALVDSGRTSAREPNIQNPPRKGKIRSCFVPRSSYFFSFVDYDTAELRALAQVCIWLLGYSTLGDALRAGEDPHLSLAADLEGITYEEAIARKKSGDKAILETRQLCKVPNFGLPGGLGPDKLVLYAHGYDPRFKSIVDLKMAQRLRDAWFKKWREMREFFNCISRALEPHGEGAIQQFWSQRVRGGVRFTQAANSTFQGLVGDGAGRAGWMLARECYLGDWMYEPQNDVERELKAKGEPSPLLDSRPVIFMHDEFGLEIPKRSIAKVSYAAERQAYVQRMAMQEVIPDVPIKCGAVVTRRWYKGAEAVRVNGFLVPSKPVESEGKLTWVADV